MSADVLLLWDIDGTICSSAADKASWRCFAREELGREISWSDRYPGTTDGFICEEIIKETGLEPTPENISRFREGYLSRLKEEIKNQSYIVHPGVRELLQAVNELFSIALLTGNWEQGARIKLARGGFSELFPVGAFSDDSNRRDELGPIALERAGEFFSREFNSVWIIGDTIHDIRCARACGARALSVATGNYSLDALAAEKPDYIVKDLSDVPAIVEILSGKICDGLSATTNEDGLDAD